jgi:hypothetical protein
MPYLRQYRTIESEWFYVAIDTCGGGGDYTAVQFFSPKKYDVPLVYHSPASTDRCLPEIVDILNWLCDETGYISKVAPERQNGGIFIIDRMQAMNHRGKYELFVMPKIGIKNTQNIHEPAETKRYGWDNNMATRPLLLATLQTAINTDMITIYDKPTIKEMLSFIVKNGKPQAEENQHDDLVLSLAIAVKMNEYIQKCDKYNAITEMENQFPDEDLFDNHGLY